MDPFVGLFIAAGAAAFLVKQRDYVVPGRRFHDSTKTAFYINTTENLARRRGVAGPFVGAGCYSDEDGQGKDCFGAPPLGGFLPHERATRATSPCESNGKDDGSDE